LFFAVVLVDDVVLKIDELRVIADALVVVVGVLGLEL
jgi:hypothetical protein